MIMLPAWAKDLVGSVALDDFHDEVSDVDFVAVATEPDPELLRHVHEGLPKFDGLYVTFDELRTSAAELADGYYRLEGELRRGKEGRSPVPARPQITAFTLRFVGSPGPRRSPSSLAGNWSRVAGEGLIPR